VQYDERAMQAIRNRPYLRERLSAKLTRRQREVWDLVGNNVDGAPSMVHEVDPRWRCIWKNRKRRSPRVGQPNFVQIAAHLGLDESSVRERWKRTLRRVWKAALEDAEAIAIIRNLASGQPTDDANVLAARKELASFKERSEVVAADEAKAQPATPAEVDAFIATMNLNGPHAPYLRVLTRRGMSLESAARVVMPRTRWAIARLHARRVKEKVR
jgi:hypothetical protein